jgi:hypothetical protein
MMQLRAAAMQPCAFRDQLQTSFIWGDLVLRPNAKLDLLERQTEVEWVHLIQKLTQDFKCLRSILRMFVVETPLPSCHPGVTVRLSQG